MVKENRQVIKVKKNDAARLKELSPELVDGETNAPYWVIVANLIDEYESK